MAGTNQTPDTATLCGDVCLDADLSWRIKNRIIGLAEPTLDWACEVTKQRLLTNTRLFSKAVFTSPVKIVLFPSRVPKNNVAESRSSISRLASHREGSTY
jgi:hypothetical protein